MKDSGPGLHYLQEDNPGKIACIIPEWLRALSFEDFITSAMAPELEEALHCCQEMRGNIQY